MDRRNAIATLSCAVAAAGSIALPQRTALAQQAQPGVAASNSGTLDSSQYKMNTLRVGTFAKETSLLALNQATHPKVKEFAQFEADEQTTIAQVLTDTKNPPPAPLDQALQEQLMGLRAKSGKQFDAAYVQGQIAGHQQLLAIQQGFLNGAPNNHDQEHIAMLARTVIQMHLTMLQDLQSVVGSA